MKIRPSDLITAPTVASADELNQLFSRSAAIVHIDVDWSVTAVISRPAIAGLRESLAGDEFLRHIPIRRVDCSKQKGEVWDRLYRLLTNEHLGLMGAGNGELLFIKYGKVVDAVPCAYYEGAEKLIERARQIYR